MQTNARGACRRRVYWVRAAPRSIGCNLLLFVKTIFACFEPQNLRAFVNKLRAWRVVCAPTQWELIAVFLLP